MKFNNETLKVAVREWLSDSVASESKYGPISNWDTSQVTNMSNLFFSAKALAFNQPLNDWDVSNVTCMKMMFFNAQAFNQPLNDWDVSNVANMNCMFNGAMAFNQPLNNWNVSNVTDMGSMFFKAMAFNQPLNNWNVSNVVVMDRLFYEAYVFNHPLNDWDVSSVKDFDFMFFYAKAFNQPLNDWKLSNDCFKAMKLSSESTSKHKGKSISSEIHSGKIIKLKYFKNNGAGDLDHNPLTGRKVDYCIAKPFDFNAIIEIEDEVFHINYILIEASKEHDLDYIYIGLCDKDFNVKKWIDPEKSKAKFVKKLYLLGEILIDEDLCEACSVRYIDIDDFDSHDLDDSYDYKKLLEVRENW